MDFVVFAHLVLRMAEFPAVMVALVIVWLLIIGGSLGSFLNVVIYRLPAGLSLVRPASRCPRCETPIRPRDNIPVVGWLVLRGKCRACGTRISARYPLVEATMALIFLALAWLEPLNGGLNLPIALGAADKYPLWGTLLYHFALMCGLVAAALMMYDGEAVPRKFWLFLWIVGFTAGALWPLLRPIGMPQINREWGVTAFGLIEGAAGTLLGIALGSASWPASTAVGHGRAGNVAGPAALALVGVFLGWQAAAGVSIVAATLWSAWQMIRYSGLVRVDFGWPSAVALTTFAWLLAWRWIVQDWSIIGTFAPWYLPPLTVGVTLLLTLSGRTLADSARRRLV